MLHTSDKIWFTFLSNWMTIKKRWIFWPQLTLLAFSRSLVNQPLGCSREKKKYSHSIANVWRNQHITIVIIVRVYQSTPVQWIVAAVAVAVAAAAARPGMSVARTFDKFFQIVCVWAKIKNNYIVPKVTVNLNESCDFLHPFSLCRTHLHALRVGKSIVIESENEISSK